MSTKCKAKNPSQCSFHGEKVFDATSKEVSKLKKSISKVKDYAELEKLKIELERITLNMDVTPKGFKLLSEQLDKAAKKSSKKEIKILELRLKKADEERQKILLEEANSIEATKDKKPSQSASRYKPKSLQEIADKLRNKRRRKVIKRIDELNANNNALDYRDLLNDFSEDDDF